MSKFQITVVTPVDFEGFFVELWHDEELVVEMSSREGRTYCQICPRSNGEPWLFTYDELISALSEMKGAM